MSIYQPSWKPIETAPKHNCSYLVYLPDDHRKIQTCYVNSQGIKIIGNAFSFDMSVPTHWMELPDDPT